MRPQKVLDKEIVTKLVEVFRSNGYDGASLSELAEKTGLKKASLYHRFPEGKQGMAVAVLNYLGEWAEENVFNILNDETIPPAQRLLRGLDNIRVLYSDGKNACVLRAFSLGSGLELFENQIKNGMTQWIDAFKTIGKSFGLSEGKAQKYAVRTLVELQGSLVVTKGLNDLSIFDQTLKDIESKYLNK
ncbi:TetR/AcrR family transcriptional regulator [Zobellia uliginosa]|uniref:TetR/AcrR family transcriptional regulator n=1 Tax=Zobellia uliginosa TaxID=143224 RepID=UPI001C07254A|nr:TetR/AcrR family transcriptional regulator [Zobellia uliginosa]MBU2948642.1 TetR/AcrR family transcriptional regulator [Zobellia uliginosa]